MTQSPVKNIGVAREACHQAAREYPGTQFYVIPAGKRRYEVKSFDELIAMGSWPVPVYAWIDG